MNEQEMHKRYTISKEVLACYKACYPLSNTKKREYQEEDIEIISKIATLKSVGMKTTDIMQYIKDTTNEQKEKVLAKTRAEVLDTIHDLQKHLDSIDYLIYEIKEGK